MNIQALPLLLEEEVILDLTIKGSNPIGIFKLDWSPNLLPSGVTATLLDTETGESWDLSITSSVQFELTSKGKVTQSKSDKPVEANLIPNHKVLTPKVLKAKTSGISRFVILLTGTNSVSNEPESELPESVQLSQNYPNPFNPNTTINFAVPEYENVQLEVFDLLGRKVSEILNEPKNAGRYSINFDASNLTSGLYLYRLQVGEHVLTKKMTLIK